MKKIYNLRTEPTKEIYRKLLLYSLEYCDSFILVLRSTIPQTPSAKKIIKKLEPYVLKISEDSEWPGTKLTDNTATVYKFKLNRSTLELLLESAQSLYSWIQPNLPEDLCIIRHNNEPLLVTISHEKDGYLELTPVEKEDLLIKIPELELS